MLYDNLSNVSQNVLKFYQQLTGEEMSIPVEISHMLFILQILRNTTQVIIRHRVKIKFSVISNPITQERQK
jgi:hypothetical protein